MRSESEIRDALDDVEDDIDKVSGHDKSHLLGARNMLRWVLEDLDD